MGRKKIPIKRIENRRERLMTFHKRRLGLLKKAAEISILCYSRVYLAFTDLSGSVFQFDSFRDTDSWDKATDQQKVLDKICAGDFFPYDLTQYPFDDLKQASLLSFRDEITTDKEQLAKRAPSTRLVNPTSSRSDTDESRGVRSQPANSMNQPFLSVFETAPVPRLTFTKQHEISNVGPNIPQQQNLEREAQFLQTIIRYKELLDRAFTLEGPKLPLLNRVTKDEESFSHLWRPDPIISVRESIKSAFLQKINGRVVAVTSQRMDASLAEVFDSKLHSYTIFYFLGDRFLELHSRDHDMTRASNFAQRLAASCNLALVMALLEKVFCTRFLDAEIEDKQRDILVSIYIEQWLQLLFDNSAALNLEAGGAAFPRSPSLHSVLVATIGNLWSGIKLFTSPGVKLLLSRPEIGLLVSSIQQPILDAGEAMLRYAEVLIEAVLKTSLYLHNRSTDHLNVKSPHVHNTARDAGPIESAFSLCSANLMSLSRQVKIEEDSD